MLFARSRRVQPVVSSAAPLVFWIATYSERVSGGSKRTDVIVALPAGGVVAVGVALAAGAGAAVAVRASAVAVSTAPSSTRWTMGRYCTAVGVSGLPTLQVKPPGAIAARRRAKSAA